MAPTADAADGTEAGALPNLTAEQQAELDKTAKKSGKVAAGKAAYAALHPRREGAKS